MMTNCDPEGQTFSILLKIDSYIHTPGTKYIGVGV